MIDIPIRKGILACSRGRHRSEAAIDVGKVSVSGTEVHLYPRHGTNPVVLRGQDRNSFLELCAAITERVRIGEVSE